MPSHLLLATASETPKGIYVGSELRWTPVPTALAYNVCFQNTQAASGCIVQLSWPNTRLYIGKTVYNQLAGAEVRWLVQAFE